MKKTKKQPKKVRWFFASIGVVLILVGLLGLLNLDFMRLKRAELEYRSELPTLKVFLNNVTLDEIKNGKKTVKYQGNYAELDENQRISFFSDVEIKGRGNSTWGLPKSPYQIKLNQKTDMLGLGAAKKWLLIANYVDDSNLRNDIAYKFAQMVGEKYAVRGEFVRLFVDNEYIGLYYLTNKIEISKNSVDLRDFHGVLMEIDILHRSTEECINSKAGTCMVFKEAVMEKDEETKMVAIDEFMDAYNAFEEAVRAKDFKKVKELVDVESFAEYFLINEFTMNPDAYCSSFYLYKDGGKDKIHAGPAWDFDYALGNKNWIWSDKEGVYSPYAIMVQKPKWDEKEALNLAQEIYRLMEMPEFRNEVVRVFREKLAGRADELVSYIEAKADFIRDEAIIDTEKWEFGDFDAETSYLINWVRERYKTFENEYGVE